MNTAQTAKLPIADLHCDLPSYLAYYPDRDALCDQIGCGIPYLKAGNVRLQVMAFYSPVLPDEPNFGLKQSQIYQQMPERYQQAIVPLQPGQTLLELEQKGQIGMLAAIENANAFCEEHQTLKQGFQNLEQIIHNCGGLFYMSLTHAGENRFGGGNGSAVGLKPDGEEVLRYLHGRQIAIDLAHTSDALAYDILNFIDRQSLDISILATHSNFRTVHGHIRNLPDELVYEVIHRNGLIGMNFLKHMIGTKNHHDLHEHIQFGLVNKAENALAFGADYFFASAVAAGKEQPMFYDEHANAGLFPKLLAEMSEYMSLDQLEKMAYGNVMRFLNKLWKTEVQEPTATTISKAE